MYSISETQLTQPRLFIHLLPLTFYMHLPGTSSAAPTLLFLPLSHDHIIELSTIHWLSAIVLFRTEKKNLLCYSTPDLHESDQVAPCSLAGCHEGRHSLFGTHSVCLSYYNGARLVYEQWAWILGKMKAIDCHNTLDANVILQPHYCGQGH